jgi:hypothetical protein
VQKPSVLAQASAALLAQVLTVHNAARNCILDELVEPDADRLARVSEAVLNA